MNLIDSVKSMFTNKQDVAEFRFKLIKNIDMVYANLRTLYFDRLGCFIFSITFDNDLFFEFIQLAEGFPANKWKTFPFKKRTVVLVHLTTQDIKSIMTTTRYVNNPMYLKFLQAVHGGVPRDYLKDCIECGDAYVHESISIGDDKDLYDFTHEEFQTKYLPDLTLPAIKAIAYDDLNVVRHQLIYYQPGLAPYLTDWDLLDLCHILVEHDGRLYNISYRQLINIIKPDPYVSDQITTIPSDVISDLMILLKDKCVLSDELINMKRPLARQEDDLDDDIDEVLPTSVDTSTVPASNYITKERR